MSDEQVPGVIKLYPDEVGNVEATNALLASGFDDRLAKFLQAEPDQP